MRILGVDTSCDETCASVVEASKNNQRKFKVLSNIISSQIEIHRKYGGVFPSLAVREHQNNLVIVLEKALQEASLLRKSERKENISLENILNLVKRKDDISQKHENEISLYKETKNFLEKYSAPKIDLIAITIGPGLEPCLWQGINFCLILSRFWNIPIVPVNHLKAHIWANWLSSKGVSTLDFTSPAVSLIISGGHTELALMNDYHKYQLLGESYDDAAGEALDKIARLLDLPYPGGPQIEKQASKLQEEEKVKKQICEDSGIKLNKLKMPRPMINHNNYDFSFSGLKTAVLYNHRQIPENIQKSPRYIQWLSCQVQQSIIDVLLSKTLRAAKEYKAKMILLSGGVTANQALQEQFERKIRKELPHLKFSVPEKVFCTDNGAMIAAAGYSARDKKTLYTRIKAKPNLDIS